LVFHTQKQNLQNYIGKSVILVLLQRLSLNSSMHFDYDIDWLAQEKFGST